MALASLSSCFAAHTYVPPEKPGKGLFRVTGPAQAGGERSFADVPWSQLFSDPKLQDLIREGLSANLDLEIATARMHGAEAALLQAKGALFPSLSVNASASRARVAQTPSAASGFSSGQFQLYASASWEADVWGKLTSAKRAALADVLASEAGRRAVQTRLVADIAAGYYQLLSLDRQLAITERTVEARSRYVDTVRALKEAGTVTGADVEQSVANLVAAQLLIPDLKLQIRQTENALSVLLARSPGPIRRASLAEEDPGVLLTTGVPARLLANRPDVQRAELELRSAFEMVNVARAYFYPQLTLTGSAGFGSRSLADLFSPASFFANLAAGLLQPIFNGNINRARYRAAKAARIEAYAVYERTLLTAGKEVSDALYAYDMATEKIEARKDELEALEKAVQYNEELLKASEANYIDVLTSQQALLTAELAGVQDQLQRLRAIVELYHALGGGWR